jgi:hypothetical protein
LILHRYAVALKTELDAFERIRLNLLDQVPGRYALVKGRDLVELYGNEAEAIREGYRRFGNEAFLVKHIVVADVPMLFTSLR